MADPKRRSRTWFCTGLVLVLLAATAGLAWWQRTPLAAWYAVHGLGNAPEADCEGWEERVACLDAAALPRVVALLRQGNAGLCERAGRVLARVAERRAGDEAAVADLCQQLAEAFPGLSAPGQCAVLRLFAGPLAPVPGTAPPRPLMAAMTRVLAESGRQKDKEVQVQALALAAVLAASAAPQELTGACRQAVRAALRDPDPGHRAQAARVAARLGAELVQEVVPLLEDPSPEVRRAAMLTAAPLPEAVATDDLLRWLHDSDVEVRRLCEQALRGRGLREEHIRLGGLMTAPGPQTRLLVIEQLRRTPDIDPGIWLRRLTHDAAPAVRAAAVRAAGEDRELDLVDRIEQMVQNDPSSTVRQVARFYLLSRKPSAHAMFGR